MKSLREYQIKLDDTHGDEPLTWGPAYNPPMHATVNGVPVRVLCSANLPGASPVDWCIDNTGFKTFVKVTDVITTDGAYLPLHGETTPTLVGSTR